MTTRDLLLCRHCNHQEHLDTKCYENNCRCIECHTKDDLRKLYRYEIEDELKTQDPEALFNGA